MSRILGNPNNLDIDNWLSSYFLLVVKNVRFNYWYKDATHIRFVKWTKVPMTCTKGKKGVKARF